jgi:hypothetical protein
MVSTILVVLILIPFTVTNIATHIQSPDIQMTTQIIPASYLFEQPPSISIKDIVGGFGITATIKNNGNFDIDTITIKANITKGPFVRLKTMSSTIPSLAINESTKIHLCLFGISLGILTPLPEITLIITAQSIQKEAHITSKVLGSLTKIIATYVKDDAFNGYTLFSPEYSTKTFLIDKQGTIVHTWDSNYLQGLGLVLLENGDLLRTMMPYTNPVFISGGATGGVQLLDWNGTLLWQFNYSNTHHCLHHDVEVLPNGHILLIAWEYKTAEEAVAAGRNPDFLPVGELWPDHVIEVERTGPSEGTIVWEWHVWDHLIQDFDPTKENYGVIQEHPELIDINYGSTDGKERADWNHINSIDYNEQFDQILLSSHNQHEIWVIDHSTTTDEAAGHTGGHNGKGGDILYRYGNPEIYGAGTVNDQRFFGQHDAQWILPGNPGEGHLLVFNNGQGRPQGQYSSVDEYIPPADENGSYHHEPGSAYGPKDAVWSYTADNPFDFFAGYLSSTQRLPNGNTLICDGDHGFFFEVTPEKNTIWTYQNLFPSPLTNQVFKILCYAPDYPGLRFLKP